MSWLRRRDRWTLAIGATAVLGGYLWFAIEVVGQGWDDGGWFSAVRAVVSCLMCSVGIIAWIVTLEDLGFDMSDNE